MDTDDDQQMQQAQQDEERRRSEEEHIDAVWACFKQQHQPPTFGVPGHREPWEMGSDYRIAGRSLYYNNILIHTFEKGEKIR